jgi:hypothetical protein
MLRISDSWMRGLLPFTEVWILGLGRRERENPGLGLGSKGRKSFPPWN